MQTDGIILSAPLVLGNSIFPKRILRLNVRQLTISSMHLKCLTSAHMNLARHSNPARWRNEAKRAKSIEHATHNVSMVSFIKFMLLGVTIKIASILHLTRFVFGAQFNCARRDCTNASAACVFVCMCDIHDKHKRKSQVDEICDCHCLPYGMHIA